MDHRCVQADVGKPDIPLLDASGAGVQVEPVSPGTPPWLHPTDRESGGMGEEVWIGGRRARGEVGDFGFAGVPGDSDQIHPSAVKAADCGIIFKIELDWLAVRVSKEVGLMPDLAYQIQRSNRKPNESSQNGRDRNHLHQPRNDEHVVQT